MTPYEAVFDQEARVGPTTDIPAEFLENVTNGIYKLLELLSTHGTMEFFLLWKSRITSY